MAEVEILAVDRTSRFISYTLACDLQVKIHRSSALGLLRGSFARPEDVNVIEFSAEKFDKIMTFLTENDQQVHYANSANTVGVYAIVRLLGDLRRQLRDYRPARPEDTPRIGDGHLLTPRVLRARDAPQNRVPPINVGLAQAIAGANQQRPPQGGN